MCFRRQTLCAFNPKNLLHGGGRIVDADVLTVWLGWFFAVTGWAATIVFGIRSMRLQKRLRTFEIRDVISDCRDLAKQMKRQGFNPDIIIVPGEKNALIAHFIKEFCQNNPVVIVTSQVYHGDEFPQPLQNSVTLETPRSTLIFPVEPLELAGKKVLFVDSIKKSGTTLFSVKRFLLDRGMESEDFKSLCLVNSQNYQNAPKPDYFYKNMEGEVIFPWQTVHVT